jgi:hypothetical protein
MMTATSGHAPALSRRGFLATSAVVGVGFVAGPILGGCGRADGRPNASEAAWRDLAGTLRGRVLRPGDHGFEAAALPDNVRFASVLPEGIAQCASVEDVAYALQWCQDNGMPQVPRSGGHSYYGYSTTEGLLISVTGMNSVRYEPQSARVVAAGGAQNKNMVAALQPHNVMVPGGNCPTVGVAGLTLGGGLGYSMRSLGLTSDSLVSTQVVLADGQVVTASATENPDLFWAVRGGAGGNFGINIEFTWNAYRAKDCTWFTVRFPAARHAAVLEAFFDLLERAPHGLGFRWYGRPAQDGKPPLCGVTGQMYGTEADTRDVLAGLMRAGGTPLTEEFHSGSYWESTNYLASTPNDTAYSDRNRFIDTRFGPDAIGALVDLMDARPPGLGYTAIFAWGGAVRDVAPDATAFVHRNDLGLIVYSAVWERDDQAAEMSGRNWVDKAFIEMQPYTSRRSFQNFPDGQLTDWAQAYYGPNLPRLSDVKSKVDPGRVFNFPQAIPNA